MRNPLQEQLLKAGLAKKAKLNEVAREQNKQRHARGPVAEPVEKVDTRQLQAERAERDRALAAERNAQARAQETRAQIRQIVETNRVKGDGDIAYAFTDGGKIRNLLVGSAQRALLIGGGLLIVRHDDGHALLPRAAAEKVAARDASVIVVDNGQADAKTPSDDDDHYSQFKVPDDLIW